MLNLFSCKQCYLWHLLHNFLKFRLKTIKCFLIISYTFISYEDCALFLGNHYYNEKTDLRGSDFPINSINSFWNCYIQCKFRFFFQCIQARWLSFSFSEVPTIFTHNTRIKNSTCSITKWWYNCRNCSHKRGCLYTTEKCFLSLSSEMFQP